MNNLVGSFNSFMDYYQELHPEIKEYFQILSPTFPAFLIPFIESKTLKRISGVSYFCAMDHASKDIYNFKYYYSTLDHSIATALITWKFTNDVNQTLAALFHDATKPATSHVVDYLNKDFVKQESTEKDIYRTLARDKDLITLVRSHGLNISDIFEYKKYPLVDNERPRLCADRLEGIFSSSLIWTKETILHEIKTIYNNISLKPNEDGILEFSFNSPVDGNRMVELNDSINKATQSDEDYYFFMLLASMIERLIFREIIKKEELYEFTDHQVMNRIEVLSKTDLLLDNMLREFKTLKKVEPQVDKEIIKDRSNFNPLIGNLRYSKRYSMK